jgi:hypothetical protein
VRSCAARPVLTVSQIDDDEALDGTDHATHREQASMIRRYIIWRNNHAYDERPRRTSTGQT